MKNIKLFVPFLFAGFFSIYLLSCSAKIEASLLNHTVVADEYFVEDADWYIENVPFFQCSDKQIEQVYYYRWKLYKAHIRSVGNNSFVITEFINHVAWDRDPYCTINAASMHHIYEGRWLKDQRYMNGYIDYLYKGGNNRKYSESVADASYARYLVNSDSEFIISQLDSMKSIYNQWDDHWEASKGLYYIPAMPDATEYTIASIDASGGKDGFEGGDAFRPTINSYMYGNALAISRIAAMKGDTAASREYLIRASSLKKNIEDDLWNESLEYFSDRFKVGNQYVHYWDFIRGRELAGLIPWHFNLPADKKEFSQAWKHITDTTKLLGRYGFRTNEPSYEYYFKQFLYHEGKRGSQWNGPSWPYQTSLVLNAMANFLNNYNQDIISNSDYVHSLRLYTQQHYLADGTINLVENYDPNLGEPIVHYYWSNHYNHSSYNNLVITGLCGIRPSEGSSLMVNPLIDHSIDYFCLDKVLYHGHILTIVYDKDGAKYNIGKGLTVFVDGQKRDMIKKENGFELELGESIVKPISKRPVNIALNILQDGYPRPSSSIGYDSLYQAIDGRIRYFPEMRNGWSTFGSGSETDWFMIEFGQPKEISCMKIYPFVDGERFGLPDEFDIEYEMNGEWQTVNLLSGNALKLKRNTGNVISFEKILASSLRLKFVHKFKDVFLSEIECFQ